MFDRFFQPSHKCTKVGFVKVFLKCIDDFILKANDVDVDRVFVLNIIINCIQINVISEIS